MNKKYFKLSYLGILIVIILTISSGSIFYYLNSSSLEISKIIDAYCETAYEQRIELRSNINNKTNKGTIIIVCEGDVKSLVK